jgi:hypothetical protein
VEIGVPHQHGHAFAERASAVVDVMPTLALLDPKDLMKIMVVKIPRHGGVEKAVCIVVVVPGGDEAF